MKDKTLFPYLLPRLLITVLLLAASAAFAVDSDGDGAVSKAELEAMQAAMAARGPDGKGKHGHKHGEKHGDGAGKPGPDGQPPLPEGAN